MQRKKQFFEQQYTGNVLYHGTLMDLICQNWDLYYAEALNSILPQQSITQTYSKGKKNDIKSKIKP